MGSIHRRPLDRACEGDQNFNLKKPGYRVQANWQKLDDLYTVEIAHGYEYLEETKTKFTVNDDYHCALTRCPDGKWGRGLDCFELPHEVRVSKVSTGLEVSSLEFRLF